MRATGILGIVVGAGVDGSARTRSETVELSAESFGGGSFLRRSLTYFGPALIVGVAYIDPSNYGTDISGGASFGYSMLWVIWLAGIIAMLLQYLSGKLGIATGHSLPELIRPHLKKRIYIVPYWLASEVAAAMTDLALNKCSCSSSQ